MDVSMIEAAGQALVLMADPYRLMFLLLGVVLGLVLGIIPGIGGIAGTALLLPFTFTMDPYTAFAFLLGLGAVTSTGDPIPAVLFGVPGGAGSAATVLDGLPMAKRGEAGRALSAAYMSSLMGGVFGALLLAMTIPLLRPLMLYIGSPELLAFSIFGISMVAVLSGSAPLRGLAAGGLGVLLAMVGATPHTGTFRWTLDTLYLWEGLHLVPVVLGLFALPELCDLAISRSSITQRPAHDPRAGMWRGAMDCFRNWWLVLRCSWLGAGFGAVPGIGSSVIDWLAYGHAVRTEKGAERTFGQGDVRGVIAAESANNAKEGGALVPTIAFGVPGSAGMAILLGAFLVHGLVPGPDMLTVHLDITYSMVWSIALANIAGAGLCYAFSGQLAKVATLRYTLILPSILGVIYIGAFEGSRNWGDLYTLLLFGLLGWTMKQLKWPRPPLILGFVLGDLIERYTFISVQRYGADWFTRPAVILLLTLAVVGLLRPFLQDVRARGGVSALFRGAARPKFRPADLFPAFLLLFVGAMVADAATWSVFAAKIVPLIVGGLVLAFTLASLLSGAMLRTAPQAAGDGDSSRRIHMDLDSGTSGVPRNLLLSRAAVFFAWLLGFMGSMATIGLIPTVPLFVVLYMRLEGREPWRLVLPQAALLTVFIYVVFDRMLTIPWPATLLGDWLPAARAIPSV